MEEFQRLTSNLDVRMESCVWVSVLPRSVQAYLLCVLRSTLHLLYVNCVYN